jgi:hypothetical protein
MPAPITSELIEARVHCRRKAFFLLHEHSTVSEQELRQVLKQRADENYQRWLKWAFRAETAESDPYPNLTACEGRFVEWGDLRAECDGISQVVQKSPGSHHRHEPHLVTGTYSITHEQRTCLAFAGFVIGEMRRYRPSFGWLIPMSGKARRVGLESLYPTVRSSIADLRQSPLRRPSSSKSKAAGEKCSSSWMAISGRTPQQQAELERRSRFGATWGRPACRVALSPTAGSRNKRVSGPDVIPFEACQGKTLSG